MLINLRKYTIKKLVLDKCCFLVFAGRTNLQYILVQNFNKVIIFC